MAMIIAASARSMGSLGMSRTNGWSIFGLSAANR
jgi:hypothetical protein